MPERQQSRGADADWSLLPQPEWSFVDGGSDPGEGGDGDRGLLGRLASALGGSGDDARVVSRVFVLGTFGTDAVADTLAAVLRRRGRETHAVTTDDDPASNRRADRRSAAIETVVVEATGTATPVRDARDLLGPPDVVVVTAIGRGELASLGPERGDVVRSIAAVVPAGAHVVNAEGSPGVAGYLETAVQRRGATIAHVGEHDADAPGTELAGAVDGALAALDEEPLPEAERDALVAASRPEWVDLPGGELFDALGVTDTVAIERLRRALAADRRSVELVAAVPGHRRDVAAALAEYAETAHWRDAVGRLHVLGPLADRVEERCETPTVAHDAGAPPDRVLEEALDDGPALVVGCEDGQDGEALGEAVQHRVDRSGTVRIG